MSDQQLVQFVAESNSIEHIFREPFQSEIDELKRFINLSSIALKDLIQFVSVYQPDSKLRDQYGMNVRVGNYYPPFGGPEITKLISKLLKYQHTLTSSALYFNYEQIHPFMDGNGRSGRALWLHSRISGDHNISRGFLETMYIYNGPEMNGKNEQHLDAMKRDKKPEEFVDILMKFHQNLFHKIPPFDNLKFLDHIQIK